MRNACSKQPERMVRGNKGSKTYERKTFQMAADQEDFIYAGITEQRLNPSLLKGNRITRDHRRQQKSCSRTRYRFVARHFPEGFEVACPIKAGHLVHGLSRKLPVLIASHPISWLFWDLDRSQCGFGLRLGKKMRNLDIIRCQIRVSFCVRNESWN
jgi:hypothetical protein